MKIWMKANVYWIPYEQGGRKKHLPSNTRYCPIIVFPEIEMDSTWSADILTNSINDENESLIDISFLAPEAPFELLKPGAKFELYEGSKLVAKGMMIKEIRR